MPETQIDQVLAVNLGGTLHLSRQVIRHMLLKHEGGVITVQGRLRLSDNLDEANRQKSIAENNLVPIGRQEGTRLISV